MRYALNFHLHKVDITPDIQGENCGVEGLLQTEDF